MAQPPASILPVSHLRPFPSMSAGLSHLEGPLLSPPAPHQAHTGGQPSAGPLLPHAVSLCQMCSACPFHAATRQCRSQRHEKHSSCPRGLQEGTPATAVATTGPRGRVGAKPGIPSAVSHIGVGSQESAEVLGNMLMLNLGFSLSCEPATLGTGQASAFLEAP